MGRATHEFGDRDVDCDDAAAVFEAQRRTTRSLWATVRAGKVITTNRWDTRQAVCSAASVMPTTGHVATSRAAWTPVSPKQATTYASVSACCSRTW